MPRCFAFRSDNLHRGVDGSATLTAEHDNQAGAQNIDPVLDASQGMVVDDVTGHSYHEQVPESLVEHDFGWHTRIRATEDDRKRVLTFDEFSASFCRLLASHTEGNHASIFKAVGRHVLSFTSRFVRMLRIAGGEPGIPFL